MIKLSPKNRVIMHKIMKLEDQEKAFYLVKNLVQERNEEWLELPRKEQIATKASCETETEILRRMRNKFLKNWNAEKDNV